MDRVKHIESWSEEELTSLFKLINKLKNNFDDAFLEKYNRSLPFADLLFDRWERAEKLGFGKGTSIYDSSVVMGNVTVGENTWTRAAAVLRGRRQVG